MDPAFGRVRLRPLEELRRADWRRVQTHFRDPEIAHLNGTPPNRLPLWLLRRVLKADARRRDRATFGVYDEHDDYIGTVELYDLRGRTATLGIIIGERTHWNRGYGPEAIHALLDHAFRELGLDTVRLTTFADNDRAQAAFRKAGFRELRRTAASAGRTDVHMEIWRDAWATAATRQPSRAASPDSPLAYERGGARRDVSGGEVSGRDVSDRDGASADDATDDAEERRAANAR
ncbi:MAG: GNAT family N-acetyltransferase [Trueperaceae bacterium]|nr:GNAT family N-acetyltransferase [Trueperaceae bacterium]